MSSECGVVGPIANTDTFGVLLTFALLLEYTWFLLSDRASPELRLHKRTLCGVATYVVFLAMSFACLIPTTQVSVTNREAEVYLLIARAYIPLSARQKGRRWTPGTPLDPGVPCHYWNIFMSAALRIYSWRL